MTQITRVPVGLQKFLGTQAQGKNPSELGQLVTPTIDLMPFLAVQQEYWEEVTGFFSANTILYITVPDTEVWLLRSVGIYHSGGGSGSTYISSAYMDQNPNTPNPNGHHPLMGPYTFVEAASNSNIHTMQLLNDVVAYAGSRIAFQFTEVAATNTTPKGYARFIKLEI